MAGGHDGGYGVRSETVDMLVYRSPATMAAPLSGGLSGGRLLLRRCRRRYGWWWLLVAWRRRKFPVVNVLLIPTLAATGGILSCPCIAVAPAVGTLTKRDESLEVGCAVSAVTFSPVFSGNNVSGASSFSSVSRRRCWVSLTFLFLFVVAVLRFVTVSVVKRAPCLCLIITSVISSTPVGGCGAIISSSSVGVRESPRVVL